MNTGATPSLNLEGTLFTDTKAPAQAGRVDRYQEAPAEAAAPSGIATVSAGELASPLQRRLSPASPPATIPVRMPKVSILVPTYNYARYLRETIESVLNQDFEDFELIIVDDCSSDNSHEVIAHYAAQDGRIRYQINAKNLGMVANWNYCLSLAKGEYIKFLFGDDTLADRQALTKMVRMLEENPSAVLAVSARNILDEHSQVIEIMDHLGTNGVQLGQDVIVRCLESNANLIGEPSVVLMRKCDTARGFNPSYRQLTDLEMWFHLLEKGNAIYTSEPLCSFRKHPQQQTEVNKVQQIGEKEQLVLLTEFYKRPWVKTPERRKLLFSQLYWLRKNAKKGQGCSELEHRLASCLGDGWYAWLYFLHKLCRPAQNLQRFYYKRILRRPVK
ncbi:glycosyltransferase family 2 protein [Pedosphaera parvula]|uniref:Glycosyl transferase family 2 n=1 Tax=Pedosphaera parvula (strain Ellin514) TaxID=320771 RepID=B9XPL8_PEDPL|nr:glycosyltransferase family 2 protein [Pedosphaera parvula]EEF58246.1 glycosyl transferase family 2 [Pedosphaera parvula Ellin514]